MPERIPAQAEVTVVVARSERVARAAALNRPLVAVLPVRTTWNDYGLNYFADLFVIDEHDQTFQTHMRVMFEGATHSESVFLDMLERFGNIFSIEEVDRPFVSLIPRSESYAALIGMLGFDVAVSALRMLRDAVVVRLEGEDEESLRLSSSADFHIGALRATGANDALYRGARHFRRATSTPMEDAAINVVFTAQLKSADNLYEVPFCFQPEELFPERICVLIGKNGVGKTQLLKSIVDGLYDAETAEPRRSHFTPPFAPTRVLVFSSVPTDPFPRSIGAWRGIDYEYFAINAARQGSDAPLLSAIMASRNADDGEQSQRVHIDRMHVIKQALDKIGLWHRLHLPLRSIEEGNELPNVVTVDGRPYFPISRSLNERNELLLTHRIDWERNVVILNDAIEPRDLSSGEFAMLRFICQVSGALEQGSLLLLDEPETHLHPNFVSDLMEILDSLLQATKSVAIIATHSAYVVREVPKSRVNILTLEDREILIDPPRLQTFGASIDTISQFVFHDTNLTHRYQKTLAKWAERVGREKGLQGIVEQYGAQLNPESLSFIARQLRQPPASD
ncbi:AAA family ATPase [Hansschlegelia beijingensis]|uniref:AAA family ATPase n=1 Tax=Hansschlegelia beijingensis TaxID=1133344 RepID=UPI00387EF7CB